MWAQSLDVFMAGDDVEKKKPDPSIYRIAAQRLGVDPKDCLVVEDSIVGLKVSLPVLAPPAGSSSL
jgi:HAD superfamily hydrolase (TIGR01509 family)